MRRSHSTGGERRRPSSATATLDALDEHRVARICSLWDGNNGLPSPLRGSRRVPTSPSRSKKGDHLVPVHVHADRNRVWRSTSDWKTLPLPPLAKGMSRHRCPIGHNREKEKTAAPAVKVQVQARASTAEAEFFGRQFLQSCSDSDSNSSWSYHVFKAVEGSDNGYLVPSEFAALASRLEAALERSYDFNFTKADLNMDGRLSLEEWEAYAAILEKHFGRTRCYVAASRVLGLRKAEDRRRVHNIYMQAGFREDPSRELLMVCSKQSCSNLLDSVRRALEQQADPNAGLADLRFNGYTPLHFLAMARSTVDGAQGVQLAQAVDTLVEAKADPHRESGEMPFAKGGCMPLRFAALLQNPRGLAALLRHVDKGDVLGDRFQWAASENVEFYLLEELQKRYGAKVSSAIASCARFGTQATILLQLFASPIVPGNLTVNGIQRLEKGEIVMDDGSIRRGLPADINGPGLDGITPLMDMVKQGSLPEVLELLKKRANPDEQDSEGATALHYAATALHLDIVKTLLDYGAHPHIVDEAGFSAWMLVGESIAPKKVDANGRPVLEGELTLAHRKISSEITNLLKPTYTPEEILNFLEDLGDLNDVQDEDDAGFVNECSETLFEKLRLHESLFFDWRSVVQTSCEGRFLRHALIDRTAQFMLKQLTTDPLVGTAKKFTKYLLQATMGPKWMKTCTHVHVPWNEPDSRVSYRNELKQATQTMLNKFKRECDALKFEMQRHIISDEVSEAQQACMALENIPKDTVTVPESWRTADPFWQTVHERNLLRYDPEWALEVRDGASCCLALLRLGAVSDLSEYCDLLQVTHCPMEELIARGYVRYSELCNVAFQERISEVIRRVAAKEELDVEFPGLVGVKRIKRLTEKLKEAREERGMLDWPGRPEEYLAFSHCFYILDTVRMSFVCKGESLADEVICCVTLWRELMACTVEEEKICVVRQKNGFAPGVEGQGGYADVKLLIYAKCGEHVAFDGTKVPLCIIGEVQLILSGYMKVKNRMHLAYEVARGSFDWEHCLAETAGHLGPSLDG